MVSETLCVAGRLSTNTEQLGRVVACCSAVGVGGCFCCCSSSSNSCPIAGCLCGCLGSSSVLLLQPFCLAHCVVRCAPMAAPRKESTLTMRWKDLEERRASRERAEERARASATSDTEGLGCVQILDWGKHKGDSFAEAWLDKAYVKWCCEHMHIHQVKGNRLAWLNYLSMKMAAEVEALDATTESATPQRLANLEARMSNMEQMLGRILIAIEESIPGSEGHSD